MSFVSENVDDRLSMLPGEILARILSLMPTKYAVRTSNLSKRWRYNWTLVTNFDFDDSHERLFDSNIFIEFVDRVFKFCKTSHLKLFRLHILTYFVLCSSASNWIDKAIRLNVCELDICVIFPEFPSSLFTCKTLTNLRLDFSVCDCSISEFPSLINLPCLKTLYIAGYYSPENFKLIHGCPVLESLFLEVSCFNDEEVCTFNIPTLKRLKLIHRSTSINKNKIVLRVPKLEYLFVGGILCSVFVMEDVSSLVEASIQCWTSTFNYLWADLLNKIRGVQNLSVEDFPFISPLPVFSSVKQLELNRLWKSGQFTHLLERCPALKVLCIDSVDWRVFKSEESSWVEFQPKLIPFCMLTNLTTIKFSKCEGDKSDMEFLEYILGNAQVLKAVTIFALENLLVEEDPWFRAQVLKFPRASPHCEIRFRSWKLPPPRPEPINVAL
ncbi:putative F-box domain, FBD domain, leucine-rich repeat domain superfamily [Helianthus annuus]|nr:putative F-box domain, FBD domain, leucine-rich repeat domain superfamily [Helianthus annuus]